MPAHLILLKLITVRIINTSYHIYGPYVDHGYHYHSAFLTLRTPMLANTFF
jgi:hypothetical protein